MGICQIEIRAYHTWVRLGCTEEERSFPQEVEFDVHVAFDVEPPGTRTDRLSDTLCYGSLCDTLEQVARAQPYQLIEALGRNVYEALQRQAGSGYSIQVAVHKLRPPIDALRGGVRFVFGDTLPGKSALP